MAVVARAPALETPKGPAAVHTESPIPPISRIGARYLDFRGERWAMRVSTLHFPSRGPIYTLRYVARARPPNSAKPFSRQMFLYTGTSSLGLSLGTVQPRPTNSVVIMQQTVFTKEFRVRIIWPSAQKCKRY